MKLKRAQIIDPLMKPRPEQPPEPVLSRTPDAPEMDASKFWMQRKFNRRTGRWVWIPFLLLATVLFVPAKTEAADECPTVAYGQVSERVLQAQYRLRAFGYVLDVDGQFGPRTLKVVQTFQRQNGLLPDGIVGPVTQKALGCGLAPAVRLNPPPAPAPSAPTYNGGAAGADQWYDLAMQVGWTDAQWPVLRCIISRESRGIETAKNPSSSATGLLQILARYYPGENLYDGETNLRVGLALYQSSGWRPWRYPPKPCYGEG